MNNRDGRVAARRILLGLSLAAPFCLSGAVANERLVYQELSRLAIGPISFVDTDAGVIDVLGQRFKMTPATRQIGWSDYSIPAVGDYVLTVGLQADQGIATAVVARISDQYAPGASPVFLRASVESWRDGIAKIPDSPVTIDFTPAMFQLSMDASGDRRTVDILGFQPQPGGAVIAASIAQAEFDSHAGRGTGALLDISASDLELLSISGSDYSALSISGVELASLLGHQSIAVPMGTLLSITGSDSAGLSISGSDNAGLSISGSDSAQWSISGSDNAGLSISGSDSARLSISGSDSAQWSISGSDNAGLSISGSDSARLSISGSDSAQWSISGSDSARLSISGSDSAQWSISGSDNAGLSISGSDSARLSISGSDRR